MARKRITETLEAALVVTPDLGITTDNMVTEWGGIPYAPLSAMLVHLKFLAQVHQNHHWTAKADPFYGDHLLFSRLYEAVTGEIDSVAEKAIGLGNSANVDLTLQTMQLMKLVQGYGSSGTIPVASELARRSYVAEMTFLKTVDSFVDMMRGSGQLTRGLDNLIAGIQDTHESHIYLLKQRSLA